MSKLTFLFGNCLSCGLCSFLVLSFPVSPFLFHLFYFIFVSLLYVFVWIYAKYTHFISIFTHNVHVLLQVVCKFLWKCYLVSFRVRFFEFFLFPFPFSSPKIKSNECYIQYGRAHCNIGRILWVYHQTPCPNSFSFQLDTHLSIKFLHFVVTVKSKLSEKY